MQWDRSSRALGLPWAGIWLCCDAGTGLSMNHGWGGLHPPAGDTEGLCPWPGGGGQPEPPASTSVTPGEFMSHHPRTHSPHLPLQRCRWAGRARPAPGQRTSPVKGKGEKKGGKRWGKGKVRAVLQAVLGWHTGSHSRGLPAQQQELPGLSPVVSPGHGRGSSCGSLTHIPLVGCGSNSRGSSRAGQADEVPAAHVAGKQGCAHLGKSRNQLWPWQEHREAVPPLLAAENVKSLSASATFFFSLQVQWPWHLSPAPFTIHCQFVGVFRTILIHSIQSLVGERRWGEQVEMPGSGISTY